DALPGNAAQMLMGADSSPEAIRAMTVKLGLDQPLAVRYLHWIGGLLVGDLGNSYSYGTPVADLIAERLALTIPLAVMAMLLTVVTLMGLQFANLLAGAIVIENVFYLPGLGRLIFQSISNRDLIVIRNCVMLLATMVVIVNFVVDVLYAAIDPRIKASEL